MSAEQEVANLLIVGEKVMSEAYGVTTTIWFKSAGDAKFAVRIIKDGKTTTIRKMDEVACWLSYYWPKDVEWPKNAWRRPTQSEVDDFMETLDPARYMSAVLLKPPKSAKKAARPRRTMEAARRSI